MTSSSNWSNASVAKTRFHPQNLLGSPALRFLLAGGLNTLTTYLLYLLLLASLGYRVSYTISFTAGIVLAYFLNRLFVFKTHRGARSLAMLPLVYLAQYGLGAGIVHLWVEVLGQAKEIAPLLAVVITIPVTFLLSKLAFVNRT